MSARRLSFIFILVEIQSWGGQPLAQSPHARHVVQSCQALVPARGYGWMRAARLQPVCRKQGPAEKKGGKKGGGGRQQEEENKLTAHHVPHGGRVCKGIEDELLRQPGFGQLVHILRRQFCLFFFPFFCSFFGGEKVDVGRMARMCLGLFLFFVRLIGELGREAVARRCANAMRCRLVCM